MQALVFTQNIRKALEDIAILSVFQEKKMGNWV